MNHFSSQDVREFPAKTVSKDGHEKPVLGISILQHGCLAGLVLKSLLDLIKVSKRSELLPPSLMTLAALHDVGKANPYFLRRLIDVSRVDDERWTSLAADALPGVGETPHPVVSYAVLKDLGASLTGCRVVAQHHGKPLNSLVPSAGAEILGGEPWKAFRKALADEILKLSGTEGFPVQVKDRPRKFVQAELWLGYVILADWIASRQEEPVPAGEEQACASRLVKKAGFRSLPLQNNKAFKDVFGFEPRRAQSMMAEAYIGPGVYVLEAPTGCGKTEAALGLAFQAMQKGDASGVYFALPTQLTSNRVHERVQAAATSFLGEKADVRLTHGGARLMSVRLGKEAEPGGIWYTSSRLALLSPFGVGTVDQALLSILNTRFHQLRLAGLCGKVVILDEVHSYDAYTLELIARLVQTLEAIGAVVIILSATLTKAGLGKILGNEEIHAAKGIVSLTVKTKNGICRQESDEADVHPVAVSLLEQDDAEAKAFKEALERVKAGLQVLWIENTVKAAQRIYERFAGEGVPAGLLHSRFRPCDREANESLWTDIFGKKGKTERAKTGRILVGTQVLEQSLDLDADFLVTRIAPIDLLVQRFGRLWRHSATPRPAGCVRAEALVLAAPEEEGESPMLDGELAQPFGVTGLIYHPYHLMRTIETLRTRLTVNEVLDLPSEVRGLLASVFDAREETTSEGRAFKAHLETLTQGMITKALGSESASHEMSEDFSTRLIEKPTWETVVLFDEDVRALVGCGSREEAAFLLESRIVKSTRPIASQSIGDWKECLPEGLRTWAAQSCRFKSMPVCLCSRDGVLTAAGDGAPLSAGYSKTLGLTF